MSNQAIKQFTFTGNPIIRHKFTSDPTAIVYDDRLYIFTGHDEAPVGTEEYQMNDWLCFSSADLVNWIEHPSPLKAKDFKWATGDAYASKVIELNNKFYWIVSVSHGSIKGKAIGIAVADNPAGPYRDYIGKALITHDMLPPTDNEKANLDPAVLVDDDDSIHIFWGNATCYYARLKSNLKELTSPIRTISLPDFKEGAHIHKRKGWYYLSYGYMMPERVAYAMSRTIDGPWKFKGILNEVPGNCETNRPCIIDFRGKSYFIYHNGILENGGSHRRSVCIDELNYNDDGTIRRIMMTSEGPKSILVHA
jgi:beta-xylosidase